MASNFTEERRGYVGRHCGMMSQTGSEFSSNHPSSSSCQVLPSCMFNNLKLMIVKNVEIFNVSIAA
jgi:hypothetical protein